MIEQERKRGKRIYNGLPSNLMNNIYDQLEARIDNFPYEILSWSIFSLYLARACGVVSQHYIPKSELPGVEEIEEIIDSSNLRVTANLWYEENSIKDVVAKEKIEKEVGDLAQAIHKRIKGE